MNPTLLFIHNLGYALSTLLLWYLMVFVYMKDRKPLANRLIIWGFAVTSVYTLSHLIGVNVYNSHLSRDILMFNLANLFIAPLSAHCVIAFLGKEREQKKALIAIYTISSLLFVMYLVFPNTFLLDSAPKLYFPNYYVAGSLQWLMRLVSNILIPIYFLYEMLKSYRVADAVMKNRLRYLFAAMFFGYAFGFTAVPLVFGIPVDPVWSIFFVPFFAIPFVYGILKYDLMDIRIVAKQAFTYTFLVVFVGLFISFFNYLNNLAIAMYPQFPLWVFPLASSIVTVSLGFFIWNKFRQTERLKYEFITVVTHKFRTPLTHIKWTLDTVLKTELSPQNREDLERVQVSGSRLTELTNLLVTLSDTDDGADFTYRLEPVSLEDVADQAVSDAAHTAGRKGVDLKVTHSPIPPVRGDKDRLKSVVQILVDNAINYTPKGGSVIISFSAERNYATIEVSDTGIGIAKNEQGFVFNKFFRSEGAKKADTEGMGIGLSISKKIIERQGGTLRFQSDGEQKGARFFVRMPLR